MCLLKCLGIKTRSCKKNKTFSKSQGKNPGWLRLCIHWHGKHTLCNALMTGLNAYCAFLEGGSTCLKAHRKWYTDVVANHNMQKVQKDTGLHCLVFTNDGMLCVDGKKFKVTNEYLSQYGNKKLFPAWAFIAKHCRWESTNFIAFLTAFYCLLIIVIIPKFTIRYLYINPATGTWGHADYCNIIN